MALDKRTLIYRIDQSYRKLYEDIKNMDSLLANSIRPNEDLTEIDYRAIVSSFEGCSSILTLTKLYIENFTDSPGINQINNVVKKKKIDIERTLVELLTNRMSGK